MEEKTPAEQYIEAKKRRNDLLYDILQKFLALPKEKWKKTGPEEMSECVLQFLAEEGKDPRDITDYRAELGLYKLCVRCDRTPCPEEDIIFRAEIYHLETPGNPNKGLAFKFSEEEARDLYFNVDHFVRGLERIFDGEIRELNHDVEDLESIRMDLKRRSSLN